MERSLHSPTRGTLPVSFPLRTHRSGFPGLRSRGCNKMVDHVAVPSVHSVSVASMPTFLWKSTNLKTLRFALNRNHGVLWISRPSPSSALDSLPVRCRGVRVLDRYFSILTRRKNLKETTRGTSESPIPTGSVKRESTSRMVWPLAKCRGLQLNSASLPQR